MQAHEFFEQISHGLGDPRQVGEWLKKTWPGVPGSTGAVPTKAWIDSIESLLHGAEALRKMQLEAIHKTQQRTAQLVNALSTTGNPAEAAAAMQAFAQDNLKSAVQYWSDYRAITQNAEMSLLEEAAASAGADAADTATGRATAAKSKRRPARTRK